MNSMIFRRGRYTTNQNLVLSALRKLRSTSFLKSLHFFLQVMSTSIETPNCLYSRVIVFSPDVFVSWHEYLVVCINISMYVYAYITRIEHDVGKTRQSTIYLFVFGCLFVFAPYMPFLALKCTHKGFFPLQIGFQSNATDEVDQLREFRELVRDHTSSP